MSVVPAAARNHYLALDSLRGLCALAVVLFHFRSDGVISNLPFVRHSWMFVDFFFVLSGFVIAAAYAKRFEDRTVGLTAFMGLRFGRIYPLHLFILLAMLALEIMLLLLDFSGVTSRAPFHGNRSLDALVSNLALLHSFGVEDRLTWNGPSWSIAAEMWMYLLFAVTFLVFRRAGWLVLLLLGALAALLLFYHSPNALNTTYSMGFVRCLYGFALGTGMFWLSQRQLAPAGTLWEIGAAIVVVLFVSQIGGGLLTLLAPWVFAAAVLVFAQGKGKLSHSLEGRHFVWLGAISYSTYMIHSFIQARIGDVIKLFGAPFGLALTPTSRNTEFPSEAISGPALTLDLLTMAMLLVVIGCASLTYKWVETPCREWSRRIFARPTGRSSAG